MSNLHLQNGSAKIDATLTSSVLVTFILAVAAFVVAIIYGPFDRHGREKRPT